MISTGRQRQRKEESDLEILFIPVCKNVCLALIAISAIYYLHKWPNFKIVIIIVEYLASSTKWNELKFSDQTELHKNSKVNARMCK